jgi:hypothetical protein
MASGDQVAVPAAHGFWAHGQPDPAQDVAREPVQQRGEEGSISRGEPRLRALQLSFEDGDLWRRARISASLARSLIGSSRSIASALVTPW